MTATMTRTIVERPILYSGPMVRGILEDRKTQTRRVAKLPADAHVDHYGHPFRCLRVKGGWHREEVLCPYGLPGDRLWVRETWGLVNDDGYAVTPSTLCYRAAGPERLVWPAELLSHEPLQVPRRGWRPSIHMPRWASRITLELTDVRVERVQDISEADAIAEGIHSYGDGSYKIYTPTTSFGTGDPRRSYETLWDSLNRKRGYGWDVNPLVWVLEFAKVAA